MCEIKCDGDSDSDNDSLALAVTCTLPCQRANVNTMLSDDFKKSAISKLEAASSGNFFRSNSPRLLPSFDRDPDGKRRADRVSCMCPPRPFADFLF